MGRIGLAFPIATVLGLNPSVDRIFNIEQGTGVGATPHRAKGEPQGVGNGMGQATVGTGRDIEQMKATGDQKSGEGFSSRAAGLAGKRVKVKESPADMLVGLKHAPSKQRAHVELTHPGLFKDGQWQVKAEFSGGQALGLIDEIVFMLEGRQTLEHRHDAVKGLLDLTVVGLQQAIGGQIREGMMAWSDTQVLGYWPTGARRTDGTSVSPGANTLALGRRNLVRSFG